MVVHYFLPHELTNKMKVEQKELNLWEDTSLDDDQTTLGWA